MNEKIKVLFIGNIKSPLAVDRYNLIKECVDADFLFFDKITMEFYDSITQESSEKLFRKIPVLKHFLSFFICFWHLQNNKYNALHFHGASNQLLTFLGFLFKLKIIVTCQGSDINNGFKFPYSIFTKLLLQRADYVTVKSTQMFKRVEQIIGRQKIGKMITINWGTDLTKSHVSFEGNGELVITSIRSAKSIYNIPVIFSAIKELKKKFSFRFIAISLHPFNSADLDLSVADEMHVNLNRSEIQKVIQSSDVVVSIPSYDGFSSSIIESLTLGALPLITNLDAYKDEFVEEDIVCKIEAATPEVLLTALHRIFLDRDRLLSVEARQHRIEFAEKLYSRRSQIEIVKDMYANIN